MYQVISIGSALVDIFIHSQNFKLRDAAEGRLLCQLYGDKIEVESFNVYTGGGGSNTSVGFARMGFQTGVICETGRDKFGQMVVDELAENQVGTKLIISEKKEQTGGSVILVGLDGDRTVMVHRGAASRLDPFDIPSFWMSQAQWVHLSSIAGRELTLKKIFSLVKRESGLKLSWNPGKAELKLLAEGKIDLSQLECQILLLNEQEWTMIEAVQKDLLQLVPQVVVTAGKKGGRVYHQQQRFDYQAGSNRAVDATGAGDGFAVGYVSGQLMDKSIEESIEMGVKNANSVIRYYGAKAGLLYQEQLA